MANPRKFSEKIALHNQKQAEETAAFERIMQEVSVTRVMGGPPVRSVAHLQPHSQGYLRPYLGGSLPNVNQIAANPQMEMHHPVGFDESKHAMRHPGRFDSRMRPYGYTHRRNVMPLDIANRHRMAQIDGQVAQYPGTYLSPPSESSWRSFALSRTNSDSALHQSVMNPNSQDPFNPSNNQGNHQGRRDFNENNFNTMSPSYKAMLESKKFEQQLQLGNRPKSCEAPNISLLPSGEPTSGMRAGADVSMPPCGTGTVSAIAASGLSHVTQIGNNTGSLPDLTNLHIPSPLSNPIDYDDPHSSQQQQAGNQNSLYNQARSTSNLPAASAISPHLAGLQRGPASPNRARRHTHNGPSPLSLGSPEHARRMKYPNVTSPKIPGVKPEMKSPPLGGSYTYPYPPSMPGPPGGGWPLQSSEHPGSPSHGQNIPSRGVGQVIVNYANGTAGAMHQQHINQHRQGGQLRIDVSAASKVTQHSPYSRGPQVSSVTSPLTSPTSPTSLCSQASFSPVTSPRHEFTTGSNPTLSEGVYYRAADMSSMQPLQHQFEHFHVVNDNGSPHHPHSGGTPMYSMLSALSENSIDGGGYEAHGGSGALSQGLHGMNTHGKHSNLPNNISKIPDIVFTGADDPQNKSSALIGGNDYGMMGHELEPDYFPGDDLKANLGLEELHMLEESNIITDPVIEDSLRLDNL